MSFVKVVTASTAAAAMGGFSHPYACSNARNLASAGSFEEAKGIHPWPLTEGAYSSAKAHVAEVDAVATAEEEGVHLFWCANHSIGGRRIVADPGSNFEFVADWAMGNEYDGWKGYAPSAIEEAEYMSASSGSGLRWNRRGVTLEGVAWGVLEFVPSESNPEYRGAYYAAWEEAEEFGSSRKGSQLVYSVG